MIDINDKNINTLLQQGHFETPDNKFIINSVKISADGALGSRGAALIHEYSDLANHKGLLLYNQQTLALLIKTAMEAGFQVNTHAIGDHANKIVLDLYEKHIINKKTKHMRHRIEHAQILQLQDIPRFSKLGVIASMQATHATSDKNMAQDRLGEERILGAYAWQKLLKANATIAGGSDFPIESANPFFGLHASITRQDHQNQPEGGWLAEDSLSITQALKTFTTNAAFSAHQENIIGILGKNKKADFIIIDQDIFKVKSSEIWKTNVHQTWVDGKRVHYN
jgi:predicted amidohydrolase YtcJ